jgi:hypothetical protein
MARIVAGGKLRSRPTQRVLVALGVLLMMGCSFLGKQVAIGSVDSCIQRHCDREQGKARQQCMTSCQRQYAP